MILYQRNSLSNKLNNPKQMKMTTFLITNWIWIAVILISVAAIVFAITKLQKPALEIPEIPTTKSADFSTDSIVSNPVSTHQWVNIFQEAAQAAIGKDKVNPWIHLAENWEKIKDFGGSVEKAMLDFIVNEAHQRIPDSATVTLSVREYSDPNSIVMEYRDPRTDSVMVTTGHDPEPALYATFTGKNDEVTYKLICANGLVRQIGEGNVTGFENDYKIQPGDNFIRITGSTPVQAYGFALKNSLQVFARKGNTVYSKFPENTRRRVFSDWKKTGGLFVVEIRPGDILRKKDGQWLYIKEN